MISGSTPLLGIDIVAEGLETLDEYEWLRGEGIILFSGLPVRATSVLGLARTGISGFFDTQQVVGQTVQICDVIGNLRGARIIQRKRCPKSCTYLKHSPHARTVPL